MQNHGGVNNIRCPVNVLGGSRTLELTQVCAGSSPRQCSQLVRLPPCPGPREGRLPAPVSLLFPPGKDLGTTGPLPGPTELFHVQENATCEGLGSKPGFHQRKVMQSGQVCASLTLHAHGHRGDHREEPLWGWGPMSGVIRELGRPCGARRLECGADQARWGEQGVSGLPPGGREGACEHS